jgi:predicted molibdopterin-dependent oxidoreductase YjgC
MEEPQQKKRDAKNDEKVEEEKKEVPFELLQISKKFTKVDVIKEGDKVLLVDNSGKMTLIKVKGSKKYKNGSYFVAGDEIIG